MRLLAPLLLCVACSDQPDTPEAELERWFERVEHQGRSGAPDFVVLWTGTGPATSRLADNVQFALWSDGHAVWREGDLLEPSVHREFRCTPMS